MEIRKGKKTWMVVMAAAILAGAGFVYEGEDAEPAPEETELDPQSLPESKLPESKGRQEIVGWQKAEETEAVQNPFSLLHETASEEQAMTATTEKSSEKEVQTAKNLPEPKLSKPANVSASRSDTFANSSEPELKGLMEGGERGRIAIVQIAGQTASLLVGESFQDCTVLAIEEKSIVIKCGGQERRLFLPAY